MASWDDEFMLHGWPEMGPGNITLEDLYQKFRRRMELERHAEDCEYRHPPYVEDGKVWECTCTPRDPPDQSAGKPNNG